jgi:hypothetical protein
MLSATLREIVNVSGTELLLRGYYVEGLNYTPINSRNTIYTNSFTNFCALQGMQPRPTVHLRLFSRYHGRKISKQSLSLWTMTNLRVVPYKIFWRSFQTTVQKENCSG